MPTEPRRPRGLLHTRLDSGIIPTADRLDLGAGYTAALAAFVASIVYGTVITLPEVLATGIDGIFGLIFVRLPFRSSSPRPFSFVFSAGGLHQCGQRSSEP